MLIFILVSPGKQIRKISVSGMGELRDAIIEGAVTQNLIWMIC